MELRIDAFNVPNTLTPANPITSPTNTNFGKSIDAGRRYLWAADPISLVNLFSEPFSASVIREAAASDYAGAAACQKCHAAEFAAQSQSAHSSLTGTLEPSKPGEWAFGAGRASDYVCETPRCGPLYGARRNLVRQIDGFALTPGHHNRMAFVTGLSTLRLRFCDASPATQQVPFRWTPRSHHPAELGVRCGSSWAAAAHASRSSVEAHARPEATHAGRIERAMWRVPPHASDRGRCNGSA